MEGVYSASAVSKYRVPYQIEGLVFHTGYQRTVQDASTILSKSPALQKPSAVVAGGLHSILWAGRVIKINTPRQ